MLQEYGSGTDLLTCLIPPPPPQPPHHYEVKGFTLYELCADWEYNWHLPHSANAALVNKISEFIKHEPIVSAKEIERHVELCDVCAEENKVANSESAHHDISGTQQRPY